MVKSILNGTKTQTRRVIELKDIDLDKYCYDGFELDSAFRIMVGIVVDINYRYLVGGERISRLNSYLVFFESQNKSFNISEREIKLITNK